MITCHIHFVRNVTLHCTVTLAVTVAQCYGDCVTLCYNNLCDGDYVTVTHGRQPAICYLVELDFVMVTIGGYQNVPLISEVHRGSCIFNGRP